FDPVMFQEALELRVEGLIVPDALNVMALDHPLDVQRRQRHAQRIVLEYLGRDRFGWTNYETVSAETVLKFLAKAFEQLNVLRFLARKLQQRPDAVIVARQLRPSVVQDER